MFDTSLECGIKAVKVRVQDVQGRLLRRCRVTLAHEFTAAIARELGPDAVAVRDALRSNAVEKAVLPIEGLAAIGAFSGTGGGVEEEDTGPTIQLEFDFEWSEDVWVFLGRNCSSTAEVVLTKRQLTLAIGGDAN